MSLKNSVIAILLVTFLGCSTGYKSDGDAVYYMHWNEGSGQHKNRLNADPKTFQILKYEEYAKDKQSVFYQGEKIIGADAASFEALADFYGRDKNFGWYGKDTIQGANGSTFQVINSYYSTDGHDYFYTTLPLKMRRPPSFKFIAGEGDLECWTTDGASYFYKNFKVPSADYKNLKIAPKSGGISSDKNWVYFLDHKLNYNIEGKWVIDTIDMATFKVTGYIECSDKYGCINVYHGREKCNE